MKYRKKPVVIEAVKIIYAEMLSNGPEHSPFAEMTPWIEASITSGVLSLSTKGARDYAVIEIKTLEGTMEATPGDYLIRGIKGELYPCKPDIFDATYESAEETVPA